MSVVTASLCAKMGGGSTAGREYKLQTWCGRMKMRVGGADSRAGHGDV